MNSASIIAIGTEITDGQIVNSNAQWLSQKLQDIGIKIDLHLCAPDEPDLMAKTMTLAQQQSSLIFICGGLGPTSDDITRNVISELLGLPLQLSEHAWQEVQLKLQSRNVIVRDAHQQQCFFPKGAKILPNSVGVAPGFYFEHNSHHYWVLPGPPHEIESIWQNGVAEHLNTQFSQHSQQHLTTWLCLGSPESELAHLAENHFKSYSFEKKLGYRLLAPYVEIKLWHEKKHREALTAIEEFSKKLGDFFVDTQMDAINQKIASQLKKQTPLIIQDSSSSGLLLNRLTQALGSPLWEHDIQYLLGPKKRLSAQSVNTLQIFTQKDQWNCLWQKNQQQIEWQVAPPSNKKSKWREAYLVEKLIQEWLKELS